MFTKISWKSLTKRYFYAKMQIMKVIFSVFERNFHNYQIFGKIIRKSENNFQKVEKCRNLGKEAKI